MTDVFDCDQTPPRSSEWPLVDRRKGWHTPNDCFKLLDVQKTMDSIFGKLADGDVRMGCIEDNIAGNHRMVCEDIKELKSELQDNSAATKELLEIIQMGKGFFKGIAWTGKWLRRIVMWVVPPVAAIISLKDTLWPPK